MRKKQENGILQIIATVAAIILWTILIFCGGLFAGQTDKFQHMLRDFQSGAAAAELLPYAKAPFDKQLTVWQDTPHALAGGALLIGSHFSDDPALLLVDEEGNILHRWNVERKLFNTDIKRWWTKPIDPQIFAIDDTQLLPDGNVIFIQDLRDLDNFRGQRLARMDADSHILWEVPGAFHHEFNVGGNPKRIYAMASEIRDELPVIGPKLANALYLEDVIYVYTLDGKKEASWSIPQAFAHSPYKDMLTLFNLNLPDMQRLKADDGSKRVLYDLLHLNSVQYLDADHAKAIPSAKEGDLLISLRGLNALAVFRPSIKQIVWATQGPWKYQHYARVENDLKLYVYDNEGSMKITEKGANEPTEEIQSRVIRFDPFTSKWDIVFASTQLHSFWRGYYCPLPNGNYIISSSQQSRVVVVSPEKKILWELRGVPGRDMSVVPYGKQISTVRYYPPSAITMFTSTGNKP